MPLDRAVGETGGGGRGGSGGGEVGGWGGGDRVLGESQGEWYYPTCTRRKRKGCGKSLRKFGRVGREGRGLGVAWEGVCETDKRVKEGGGCSTVGRHVDVRGVGEGGGGLQKKGVAV